MSVWGKGGRERREARNEEQQTPGRQLAAGRLTEERRRQNRGSRAVDRKLFDITMVSERSHFLFTPLLTSACVGTLSFRAMVKPVRRSFPDIKLVTVTATALDVHQRHLTVLQARQPATPSPVEAPHSTEIPYDTLVIATRARGATHLACLAWSSTRTSCWTCSTRAPSATTVRLPAALVACQPTNATASSPA